MKSRCVLAMALLAVSWVGVSAEAAIVGSQGFNVTALTPKTGPIGQSITLNILSSNAAQAGDFSGLTTGTAWGSYTLGVADSTNAVVVISSPGFGVFTGKVNSDDVLLGGLFRNVLASGTFVPGTDAIYGGDTEVVNGNLSITLTKSSSTSVISATVVLDTTKQDIQGIPEPSTFVLGGLAAVGMAWFRRRRA